MSSILRIARHQFSDIVRQPLVIIIICILFVLSILNGAASESLLHNADHYLLDGNDHFLSVAMSNTLYHTSILLSALSMFIGILTIAEERFSSSLGVLLAKPVYRRDILAGKFIGLSIFLLILTIAVILLCVSSIMVFYSGPSSTGEAIMRISSYIAVLFLNCTLTLSIALLIGVVFKNIVEVLIFSGIFLCLDWYYTLPQFMAGFKAIIPAGLYFTILDGVNNNYLFNTSVDYGTWLNAAFPYVIFLCTAIVSVFLFSCYVFNLEDGAS
jgi:ABC-type transport system involved in multi-copper enzyme maturation permease subunit